MSTAPLQAVIIGAGFGGLGMAIQLRQAGFEDFVILEKGDDVGGCWRENTYPGAACDVPSHLYSFSFEPRADWSRRFAPQAEILDYLRHCADRYGLRPHLRLGAEVTQARFDESKALWKITTADGAVLHARVLISACGQLNRPAFPRLPGLERFSGKSFHSARWDHGYDLEGKVVGVIGTGASAIQFVPAIAPKVARLHLFQRSAPYVLPKPDRAYSDGHRRALRRLPFLLRLSRLLKYWHHEARVLAFSIFPVLMKLFERQFEAHLRRELADPGLRRRVTPDYRMGCKRILISNDWYPALARPNVEVVTDAIREVTPTGIVTADGSERRVDAILFGTGFTATEFLAPLRIVGRDGRELSETWRGGAEAFLGVTVSGFPNLFLLYGPNTNLGHNSIVFMLESQYRYVLSALRLLQDGEVRWLDVRAPAQRGFNAKVQRALERTVWGASCSSWYKTSEGRNTNNWPWFTFHYRRRTRAVRRADYELA